MKSKNTLKTRLAALLLVFAAAISFGGASFAAAYVTTTVVSVNSAPVAENLSFETYRGVSITESLAAVDPESDAVSFSLVKEPKKGTATIENGVFTYTPAEGKKGKDTFTYVAVDSIGNISNEATVTISIKKQSTKVTYSDMEGDPAWYAATKLAEAGIFKGEELCGQYLFEPASEVTRGEFLVMCLELTGDELLEGITRTGFSDDEDIPLWQKPYVATALMCDMISGYKNDDGKIVFSSNDPISVAEAAVMLSGALDVTEVSLDIYDDACPVWAQSAAMSLKSCDILPTGAVYSEPLTRADAAVMLVNAMELLKSRK